MDGSVYKERLPESDASEFCSRSLTEEKWVDWLLGAISDAERADMENHLTKCPCCRRIRSEWEAILGPATVAERIPAPVMVLPPIPPYPSKGERSLPEAEPSDSIRRRLRRNVRLKGLSRSAKGILNGRNKLGAALACVFLLLAGIGVFLQMDRAADDPWSRYVLKYEPEALSVMESPDSVAYPLNAGEMEPGSGVVWYNEATREMLMLIGGLIPHDDQVVQVWAVKEGYRDPLGQLQYHALRAHLYVKDKEALQEADNIVLTVEPRDGSIFFGPWRDTLSVDLSGRRSH